ncbi:MAG: helix-turn-helix domain-containing protein [Pirellulales bacterium]
MANLIPLDEAAELLGISPDELADMRSRNEVHGYRDGSSWKFKESEIDRLKATLGDSPSIAAAAPAGESDFDLTLADESPEVDPSLILDEDASEVPADDEPLELATDDESDELLLADDEELTLVSPGPEIAGDITLGDEPRDPEGTGSAISLSLDGDDLDLGDDLLEPALIDDSGEMTLDASSGEINLSAASDGDFDLGSESVDPLDLSEGEEEVTAAVAEEEDMFGESVALDDDMFADAPSSTGGNDDFLLTPVEGGEVDDDDSGSQIIALDSDSLSSNSSLFGASIEDDGISVASDDMGMEEFVGTESATVASPATVMGMQSAEPPYTIINILSLMATAGLILIGGLMVTDLIWNMWSFNEPYAINSSLMEMVLGLLGE